MRVLIVQAKGEGGFAEPQTNAYISSKVPSPAPDNEFVQALIAQNKVELLEELGDKSSWEDFENAHKQTTAFDTAKAIADYKDSLKSKKVKKDDKELPGDAPENTQAAQPGGGVGAEGIVVNDTGDAVVPEVAKPTKVK